MFDAIKRINVNVKDEHYKMKYDCVEDDEDVKDKIDERFYCELEGFKHSLNNKRIFSEHFRKTFGFVSHLNIHLLLHKNKRQFK